MSSLTWSGSRCSWRTVGSWSLQLSIRWSFALKCCQSYTRSLRCTVAISVRFTFLYPCTTLLSLWAQQWDAANDSLLRIFSLYALRVRDYVRSSSCHWQRGLRVPGADYREGEHCQSWHYRFRPVLYSRLLPTATAVISLRILFLFVVQFIKE